jgi:hypothetical protein
MGKYTNYLETIGKNEVGDLIAKSYGLFINSFDAVVAGEIGESYIVESKERIKYFFKILKKEKVDHIDDLDASLRLSSYLSSSGITAISSPLKTIEGRPMLEYGEYFFILSNYIDAKRIDVPIPKEDVEKIASAVGALHCLGSAELGLRDEPFDTSYADMLKDQLDTIENSSDAALRNLLLSNKERLLRDLADLQSFCIAAQGAKKAGVITHGDLIADNMLKDKSGQIYIVDWDTARIAPPERDVWFFLKDDNAREFLSVYKEVNPDVSFNINIIGFFMYKRYLEDIVYWLDEILTKNISEEQKIANIAGIKISCLDAYSGISEIMESIKKAIVTS